MRSYEKRVYGASSNTICQLEIQTFIKIFSISWLIHRLLALRRPFRVSPHISAACVDGQLVLESGNTKYRSVRQQILNNQVRNLFAITDGKNT